MKRKELAAILSEVAPTTYNEWAGKQGVPNKAHIRKPRYRVELYTAKGDDTTDELLDEALDDADVFYKKYGREWLKDEKWYLTVYEI